MRVKGKRALVTGAGHGIGEAIALKLAQEGAYVFVTDIDEDRVRQVASQINSGGGEARHVKLDVTLAEDWTAVSYDCEGLDILVHNAGIEMLHPFEEIDIENWRRTQQVNVEGVLIGTKALLPALRKVGQTRASGASIVIMSSVMAMVGVPGQAAYNTSKGALRQMAKAMAIEFAANGWNIRVNSIHPGLIDTPMSDEIFDVWSKTGVMGTDDVEEIKTAMVASHPLGRMGKPEDIAYGALYLASDEASFMTGSELVIDGGWIAQ